jgi:endonuclease/exonuclease/phosphatase family metal-dependent hydrolase
MMPGGGYIEVLAVDFVSDPRRSRRERVARLARWTKRRARNAPLLIVGDFNAPRDSIHFEKLRKRGLKHAYEEGGRGQWPYTWPLPCPFYAIDHAWLYRLYPASYRLVRSSSSDHSRQIMDLRAR